MEDEGDGKTQIQQEVDSEGYVFSLHIELI